jgi:hypothetical protein
MLGRVILGSRSSTESGRELSVYSTDPADDLSGIANLPPPGTFVWSNGLYVFGNANQSANYSCFRF